jgi:hypothetical protein
MRKVIQIGKVKEALGEDCACYVLITCSQPAADGKMEVELNYEGDEDLAAYLIDSASQVFEEKSKRQTK